MRSILFKLGGVAVFVGGTLLSLAWAAPQERPNPRVTHRWIQQFGMVSPALGQTLRLHVVHVGFAEPPEPDVNPPEPDSNPPEPDVNPPDPDLPPGPIRVVIAFFDSDGRVIGSPIRKTLTPGKAGFVDFVLAPADTSGLPPSPIRASVSVAQSNRRGQNALDPCKSSLEILDSASGRASLHMLPAVQRALPAVQ